MFEIVPETSEATLMRLYRVRSKFTVALCSKLSFDKPTEYEIGTNRFISLEPTENKTHVSLTYIDGNPEASMCMSYFLYRARMDRIDSQGRYICPKYGNSPICIQQEVDYLQGFYIELNDFNAPSKH